MSFRPAGIVTTVVSTPWVRLKVSVPEPPPQRVTRGADCHSVGKHSRWECSVVVVVDTFTVVVCTSAYTKRRRAAFTPEGRQRMVLARIDAGAMG
jgi:hypothetical protein